MAGDRRADLGDRRGRRSQSRRFRHRPPLRSRALSRVGCRDPVAERGVSGLQPRLLEDGPPLRTPDDLAQLALIHDQAADRDPLAPTWAMWLKAAGVTCVPPASGLS